ncbi:uncharacterized protein E0L32_002690 [Thyridium curvatum]|uniref:1-alkyl-2-acetylglycerophosphocholine esterase n=1 Tax=Thyridium curvatum TaxID=1093900 RepID=A0A507BLX8_9PEZI|nr:uncharacterized protein E0L32_002690 [Thyridium curvatum]TPX18181.1 hypothetical protein E0L32_002690 [Thyridium curvatum]
MQLRLTPCLALLAAPSVHGFLLPNLTGPYSVGTVSLELIDYKRNDNFAPVPQPRDLMVSVFYPTSSSDNFTLAPDCSPKVASFLDTLYGLPEGLAESFSSQAYENAPVRRTERPMPVVLFSPGFGALRQGYTALVSDVASHGYLVIAVDHPFDSSIIEYPDGRTVLANLTMQPWDFPGGIDGALYMRVADLQFVLDSLSNETITQQIPGLKSARIQRDRVCSFGHSFGGAASIQVMKNDTRFRCGINMDGGLYGSVVTEGTDRPAMIMASSVHPAGSIESWPAFWEHANGYKRFMRINGTTHGSFLDFAAVLDAVGPLVPPEFRSSFGTIGGARMLDIESAYSTAFFGKFLKGGRCSGRLLDGDNVKYPEVTFDNSNP